MSTLAQLQADVLTRLNEPTNSTAGNQETGTGGAATIATAATSAQYLNEGAADLARHAFPIMDAGSYSWPGGASAVMLSNFPTADGAALWTARGVVASGVALMHCSRSALENYYPTWASDAPGTPLYWFETGQDGISVYPVPSGTLTVVVNGFALPAPLVSPGDTPTWLPADQHKLLVFYAATMMTEKNLEDATLAARADVWRGEYEQGKAALLARLMMVDPVLARTLGAAGGK